MELSPTALVLLGLLLAGWTFGAAWLVLAAQSRARQARAAKTTARRLTRMIDDSPAIPLLVKADGKIEGPERLAAWLGLDQLRDFSASSMPRTPGSLPTTSSNCATQCARRRRPRRRSRW